jgi:hypothetical protein
MQRPKRRLWAPKVRQDKLWRLYQNAARGILDEALVDEVGVGLYLRCESVLLVSNGHVKCPECHSVFPVHWGGRPDELRVCPGCDWSISSRNYHESWRHQDLIGTNAESAFRAFLERYPTARSPRERILLIDQVIHAFHQDLRNPTPHRSAANNLIEGNHEQVIAFLDTLAYSDVTVPEIHQTYAEWRETVEEVRRRRSPRAHV